MQAVKKEVLEKSKSGTSWKKSEEALLGRMWRANKHNMTSGDVLAFDELVSSEIGRSVTAVAQRRAKLGLTVRQNIFTTKDSKSQVAPTEPEDYAPFREAKAFAQAQAQVIAKNKSEAEDMITLLRRYEQFHGAYLDWRLADSDGTEDDKQQMRDYMYGLHKGIMTFRNALPNRNRSGV